MSTIKVTESRQVRFAKQITKNVLELLEKKGMSRVELAEQSGIPYSTLEKKLRGVRNVWWAHEFAGLGLAFDDDLLLFRGLSSIR